MHRSHRPSTTPMDFEYTNGRGPVDQSSPFLNFQQNQQSAKKRTHSVLDSPSKNVFATPSRQREPDNRSYFSQDSSKPLPLPPHVQNAWEPRTPQSTFDFSSGGETPNTPGVDSDAATPDTQLADKMGRLANGESNSPRKPAKRDSWFTRTFKGSPSPLKEKDNRYYSSKADNRIQKRRTDRSRSKKRTLRDMTDDESDKERPNAGALPAPEQGKDQQTYAMNVASFMHWVEAHPHLPSVLSYYMQLCVNFFLASGFVYILYCAWNGIMADVDIESTRHLSGVMVEIAECSKHWNDNRCENAVPGMVKACNVWETCMSRDPKKVARASVTAKTFAMIFNSFVEEFSYKSMIFTAIIIFGGFNLSNWAFGLLRHQQQNPSQQTPNPNEFMPQTPHRNVSNPYLEQNHQNYQQNWQQTPYQTPYTQSRYMDPPPLVHTQSAPVLQLPMAPQEGAGMLDERERGKTPKKRGMFR
ncbi:hypothetical protein HBI56_048850 [Parastagonospora nodorum]|nr:hypothetical protein HBI09_140580 [Parastagonospora nodorum]KAH4051262.1 hypothetical protein HBH49_115290 [Parastagonospora nodorum]KAH4303413.1 hypothetical protein HBI01_085500 [Parastagonospora nodorum]KAH4318495.1 hypothetical protein HBI02_008200 [Parastagonospora nodorum]KAH4331920.1 hypothetical protein HBI00_067840 [Parastagonospora nodorum]